MNADVLLLVAVVALVLVTAGAAAGFVYAVTSAAQAAATARSALVLATVVETRSAQMLSTSQKQVDAIEDVLKREFQISLPPAE